MGGERGRGRRGEKPSALNLVRKKIYGSVHFVLSTAFVLVPCSRLFFRLAEEAIYIFVYSSLFFFFFFCRCCCCKWRWCPNAGIMTVDGTAF